MIYLDNAATSFPKPPMVVRAMAGTLQKLGGNPGRSGHALSLCGGRIIQRCRELLAEAFDAPAPENVIFFPSCTEALNTAIRGTLCEGDEVICSHAEHNAVMRVLKGLEEQGAIRVRMLAPNSLGLIAPEALTAAITPRTALCVICHASNVTGVVQPVQQLSRALKPYGVPLLVDAAQTAGILDVSLSSLGADMIAMPGHKGLLGPHGTGVLVLGRGMLPRPLVVGGTGSQSESMIQPATKAAPPTCRGLRACWLERASRCLTGRKLSSTRIPWRATCARVCPPCAACACWATPPRPRWA